MKKIAILAEMFYHYNGELCQFGGGERYLYDLSEFLKTMKYKVSVYQFSYEKFSKKYRNMSITGLGNVKPEIEYAKSLKEGLEMFYKVTESDDAYIFLTMNLLQQKINKPCIAISHGIWWNTDKLNYKQPDYNEMFKSWVRNADHVVSVDTDTVSLCQTYCPKYVDKLTYIPNYVDINVFKPKPKKDTSKFTVLFPRRLHLARGYALAMSVAEQLTNKYKDLEFLFVGRGMPAEEQMLSEWASRKNNIRWEWHDMTQMNIVYPLADISIIPTIWAEGTSLSCLESQACGIPTISTIVGGLTDLTFNNFNGLLIKPTVKDLIEAIEYAYLHREEVKRWGKNALAVSETFNKNRWIAQWDKVLKEFL